MLTIELRWFTPGTSPPEVKNWFENDCPGELKGLEERSDRYLYVPCDYLNLKLRQDNLEVKWRQAELGIVRFTTWEGNVEKWVKWTCEDTTINNILPANALQENPWIVVQKTRQQRQYESCNLELTDLDIDNSKWWSLALEMSEESSERFKSIVQKVSKTYPGELLLQNSYAYPYWFSLVI